MDTDEHQAAFGEFRKELRRFFPGKEFPQMTGDSGDREAVSPTALPLAHAARLLSRAGGRAVTEEVIRADVEVGAPLNADGTLNLVHYAAWLVKEMARRTNGN